MADLFFKGGILMWPILACSITALAVILHKTMQYRSIMGQLNMSLKEVQQQRPPVLEPLISGLERHLGEKEIGIIGTRLIRRLERGLGTLSLISVISPLLGLTGTVLGMIKAFQSMAEVGTRVEPAILATGIWEALITTASGLLVAIAAHVAFHYLDSRMGEITLGMKEITLALSTKACEQEG
ncbi:MotA/TolQ/ExbB proton channel family protein [Desulfonatronovibrio hydrogenovorans]|uniref:MotA/TolQ/ExbB proton channel family protein n=1 Tax=Desulfonatronovibrio hydrogenovorans TaxID=53245 RepID=UPI00048F46A9|nr:MotA/TolQ/ExbB proton channel family protein [Desulfonatronovibrio hydrogenovorans]